jgi:hypothetical protein
MEVFPREDIEISGRVINKNTDSPIKNAWVYNKSSHLLVNTNVSGAFTIPAKLFDTIIVNSINFYQDTLIIKLYPVGPVKIFLQPRIYQIGEVEVKRWKNYDRFKQDVLALNLKRKQPDYTWIPNKYSDRIPDYENPESFKDPLFYLTNPISAIYYRFNKREKSKRKFHELELKERNKDLYEHKFNRKLVHYLTGLEGVALNRFIIYCDFPDGFLLESTEMEIIEAIQKKFEQYKNEGIGIGKGE